MINTYSYKIILKSGLTIEVTRDEEQGKHVIGLWKWSKNQVREIIIDFNELSVSADEIAVIHNGWEVLSP